MALLIFPLVLPILAILILLIKLDSKGPAIFKSERIGKSGRRFAIYKLRTMCLNAEEKLQEILSSDAALRKEWVTDHKLRNDPRITRVGRIIRALSLDEIPQIFNVLKGDMSFVGPRPIVEAEIVKYGKDFRNYTQMRPGITGLWQVNGRNDTSYDSRVAFDKKYVKEVTLAQDLLILLKTVPVALSKKGAY
ncbi:MAG: sugar transferase [Deltaproteobacteria bacterium]|nr:sugar transferase [Deltaproteobacteria bacterium]